MATLAQTAANAPPDSYIVYKHSQLCRCGQLYHWSKLMAESRTKSRHGLATLTHLQRIDTPQYNIPISRIIEAPVERILFCHTCYASASLTHLPNRPSPTAIPPAAALKQMDVIKHAPQSTTWIDKHGRQHTDSLRESKPKSAPKSKPRPTTIDDLLV
jgi:hypothetical protein